MFNRGFKQTVLNAEPTPPITSSASRLTIAGFCDIDNSDSYGSKVDPSPAAPGTWTITSYRPDAACKAMSITVKLYFNTYAGGGKDGGSGRKEFSFVSAPVEVIDPVAGVTQADIDAAINAGWANHVAEFSELGVTHEEQIIESLIAAGGVVTITTFEAHSNLTLLGGYYRTDYTSMSVEATILSVPEVGTGHGYQIEAEQQFATFENRNPYRIEGSGGDVVKVDGEYIVFTILTKSDGIDWVDHDGLGYGDMNTDAEYGYRGYVISVLDDNVNSALVTKLTTFVGGLPGLPIV